MHIASARANHPMLCLQSQHKFCFVSSISMQSYGFIKLAENWLRDIGNNRLHNLMNNDTHRLFISNYMYTRNVTVDVTQYK